MHYLDWLQPENPFFYWYVFFIFGPAFTLGWWGLAGMAILHVLVFVILLRLRRMTTKTKSWHHHLVGIFSLLILTNVLVGVLVYGTIWMMAHLSFF